MYDIPLNNSLVYRPFLNDCIEWCKEQQLVHAANFEIQLLMLITVGLGFIWLSIFPIDVQKLLSISEDQEIKAREALHLFGMLLIAGVVIYKTFFS